MPADIHAAIFAHARCSLPNEACGLVAIDGDGNLRMAYPLTNADPGPTTFTIAPGEHFGALMHAERHGWEIGGVFHSHPESDGQLSRTDLAQPHEAGWLHFVVGFRPREELGVWKIDEGRAVPVPWVVESIASEV